MSTWVKKHTQRSVYNDNWCSKKFHQAHLGRSERDDVLDIPPAEAGTDLQHKGHHSCRQGGRGRCAGVALSTACPLLHGPVWRHLQRQTDRLSGKNTTFRFMYSTKSAKVVTALAGGQTQMLTLVSIHYQMREYRPFTGYSQTKLFKSWAWRLLTKLQRTHHQSPAS